MSGAPKKPNEFQFDDDIKKRICCPGVRRSFWRVNFDIVRHYPLEKMGWFLKKLERLDAAFKGSLASDTHAWVLTLLPVTEPDSGVAPGTTSGFGSTDVGPDNDNDSSSANASSTAPNKTTTDAVNLMSKIFAEHPAVSLHRY